MQEFAIVTAAAFLWGVVCFAFGFVASVLLRVAEENMRLHLAIAERSSVPAAQPQDVLDPPLVPVPQPAPQPFVDGNAALAPTNLPGVTRPVTTHGTPAPTPQRLAAHEALWNLEPSSRPVPARKVYLFGDPHSELVIMPTTPSPRPPGSPTISPMPQRSTPPRVTFVGTDLLPHRPQPGRPRRRWR